MSIDLVLGKIFAGENLDEADWETLKSGDPDAWQSGISAWQSRRSAGKNPEAESLHRQLQQALSERDDWQKKFATLRRDHRIAEIARTSGCEEVEYLDFLARKSEIDLDDPAAVETFLAQLRESHPGCFASQLKSGGGSGLADPAGTLPPESGDAPRHQLDYLIQSLGRVPFEE